MTVGYLCSASWLNRFSFNAVTIQLYIQAGEGETFYEYDPEHIVDFVACQPRLAAKRTLEESLSNRGAPLPGGGQAEQESKP